MNATTQIQTEIELDEFVDALTGRGDSFRKSKPDADGLTQYVWRMARFHSGADSSMPVTASWWLQDYLDEQGIDASVSGITDAEGKAVTAFLDNVVDDVLAEFGLDISRGARRWKRAGAF